MLRSSFVTFFCRLSKMLTPFLSFYDSRPNDLAPFYYSFSQTINPSGAIRALPPNDRHIQFLGLGEQTRGVVMASLVVRRDRCGSVPSLMNANPPGHVIHPGRPGRNVARGTRGAMDGITVIVGVCRGETAAHHNVGAAARCRLLMQP